MSEFRRREPGAHRAASARQEGGPATAPSRPAVPGPPTAETSARARAPLWMPWLAAAGVAGMAGSVLVMIMVGALGPSAAVPLMPSARPWPVYFDNFSPSAKHVAIAVWLAAIVGGAGLAAALVAVRHGWRPRIRILVAAAVAAVVALMLVPPVGSNDMMDYAAYGRIAELGHSPYTMTIAQLLKTGDPIAKYATIRYEHEPSPYGPVYTGIEAFAAKLSADSAARTVFWLKFMNALAFLAVALALDRMLRSDPARRLRGQLLWTANPLALLATMAGGHMDVFGCLAGVLAVMVFRRLDFRSGVVAGLLAGLAIGIKAPFAFFAVGLAIAALRNPRALAGLCLGTVVTAVPAYLLGGLASIKAVLREGTKYVTAYEPLHLLSRLMPSLRHDLTAVDAVSILLSAVVFVVLLWGLPDGPPGLPAVRPMLALTIAWLVLSPQQRAWYDVMIFVLLALMLASVLDWLVIVRAVIGAVAELPGVKFYKKLHPYWMRHLGHFIVRQLAPELMALIIVAIVVLYLARGWQSRFGRHAAPPGQGAAPPEPQLLG